MKLIDKDAVWEWLKTAPLPVVLMICLSTTGVLAGWMWAIAGEVKDQKAVIAVAAEQALVAKTITEKSDDKLDMLLIGMAELRLEVSALKLETSALKQETARWSDMKEKK